MKIFEQGKLHSGIGGDQLTQISLSEIQRQRLVLASLLGLILDFIAVIIHIAVFGWTESLPSLWRGGFIGLVALLCLNAGLTGKNVLAYARPSILLISAMIWLEVSHAGGLTGHGAALLLLMPVVSALLLPARDTLIVTALNILAIAGLGTLDLGGHIEAAHNTGTQAALLGTMGIMIIVTAGGAGAMVVLVRQNEQVDATLRVLLQQQVYLACHDTLTGLHNRSAVNARLDDICGASTPFDIFLIDLDGFKAVNDMRGHGAGDALLKEVANRLSTNCQDGDFVGRLGGDEFVFITQRTAHNDETTAQLAETILHDLAHPFTVGGMTLQISGSVGCTRYPFDGQTKSQLLATADLALYAAKKAGKNQFRMFTPALVNWPDKPHAGLISAAS